jgi:twitching motility protein PilJ
MNNMVIRTAGGWRSVLAIAAVLFGVTSGAHGAAADDSRAAADELRIAAAGLAESAMQTSDGREASFRELASQLALFDELKGRIDTTALSQELSQVDVAWQPVKRAAQTLVDAAPTVGFVDELAARYQSGMDAMQRDFSTVLAVVQEQGAGAATLAAAQENLWLNERINRSLNAIVGGDSTAANAAEQLQADSAELLHNIELLTRGDADNGIPKLTDTRAVDALSSAFRQFSAISTSVDRIAQGAPALREASIAREQIQSARPGLNDALAALSAAAGRLPQEVSGSSGMMTLALAVLLAAALALAAVQWLSRRRRDQQFAQGMGDISDALQQLAQGDLMVSIDNDNTAVAELAKKLNASIKRQREMVQDIQAPFELSVEEVNRMGISARGLVEKGKELTRSVGEAINAATEMVRTSEEIKTSTAEAARTSDRNCHQVAQGYELTKDMSKASADVRESVQETSKSAKRQSELIQSVTAAAEYIQALNTKISVVAINTRIEAEKAGEYGRPFLGIAEAIADLLREAGDEGRKIISEVRMLQNMSAENLASMENTVGTVVTILEYIERLDSSLEEINSGSAAISSIIRSVDEAAGQSAVSALHMNSSMAQIRERNQEIGKFSESTRGSVARLLRTMRDASTSLGKFKAERVSGRSEAEIAELEPIGVAPRVYREEDMSALEHAEPARASV